jgi:membrane-associated phospholipid phosphatase
MGTFLTFQMDELQLVLPPARAQLIIYAIILVFTFLLPLLNALYLLKTGYVSSLKMEMKEERRIPYLGTAIFYFAGLTFMLKWDVWALSKMLMLGATILATTVLLINIFWKISSHMVGIGGLCGIMIVISSRLQINILPLLIMLFLIAGLVAFSRLKLNAHTPAQVYVGFLIGVGVQLVLFL